MPKGSNIRLESLDFGPLCVDWGMWTGKVTVIKVRDSENPAGQWGAEGVPVKRPGVTQTQMGCEKQNKEKEVACFKLRHLGVQVHFLP